jgi:acyl carrier protein
MISRSPGKDAILKELRSVFAAEFGLEESALQPGTRVVEDLDLDSIDFVDMAVALEVRLGQKLKEDDLRNIRTLQDIVDVIDEKLQSATS